MDNQRVPGKGIMSEKHCSIIIRTYNEEKHLGKLLAGILQQTEQNFEIIIVDSGSTDATLAIAERFPVRVVHITPQEFTFGRSLNVGCAAATGEFLVMASAHVYPVYPDWLEQLLAPFKDTQVALTYGKQRGMETTKFSEHQVFAKWFPEERMERQRTPFCNNANAAVRRSLWQQYPYDETLTGLEDLDWANWAINQGYFSSYVPEAEIIHVHDENPRGVYNRYRREAMAMKTIFPEQKFRVWDFLCLFPSNTISDIWHALRQRTFFADFYSIIWFRLMQFLGTWRGFSSPGPLTGRLKQAFYYPLGLNSVDAHPNRDIQPIDYQGS